MGECSMIGIVTLLVVKLGLCDFITIDITKGWN